MVKNSKFFELFGPPCRNPLANLDSSIPECAQVCALQTESHLATLIKIEMVAVRSTNETTPSPFCEFLTPPPPLPEADGPQKAREHVGRHCPYTSKIWCECDKALLWYRSKTAKMQKFPFTLIVTKISFPPFSVRQGPLTPKTGEDTFGTRIRPHAKLGLNRAAGCREIVDRTNKTRSSAIADKPATNRAMLVSSVCKVVEVWQDFLSEYVDKKFTYICYRRLIRDEWIYYGCKNCVIYNS